MKALCRSMTVGSLIMLPVIVMAAMPTTYMRNTTYVMYFSGPTFANAFNDRSDVLSLQGAVGDSGVYTVTGFAPGTVISVSSGKGIDLSNVQPADASGNAHYTASITGKTGVTINQFWTNTGTLSTGVSTGGLNYLDFFARNKGFLNPGGTFDFSVIIPGDWSSFGSTTGDVEFFGINPAFSITKDFVFDVASGTTTFEAIDRNYKLADSTDVYFRLYGEAAPAVPAIPEPSTFSLAALGLIAMAGVRRFRRRADEVKQHI